MAAGHSPKVDKNASRPPQQDRERAFRDLRHYVPAEILNVSFPSAVRGYDRHAVDDHIKRVNRVIAELKVSASPPAAVRHALDVAGEKVEGLLEAAREAAGELTETAHRAAEESTARIKAEAESLIANAAKEAADTIAKAKAESAKILEESKAAADEHLTRTHAEATERLRHLEQQLAAERDRVEERIRVIQRDTDAIRKQRSELLDDIRATAARLGSLADLGADEAAEPTAVAQEADTLVDTLTQAAAPPKNETR